MSATVPEAADAALAALALIDACNTDNEINKKAIIDATGAVELVMGLVVVASSFRAGMAAACGVSLGVVDEMARAMYLHHVGGAS